MIRGKIEFHAQMDFASNGWAVFVFERSATTGSRRPIKITFEALPEISDYTSMDPSIVLKKEQMVDLATALKAGLAESGFLSETGPIQSELSATKCHLEDMRKLVFITVKESDDGRYQPRF